MTDKPETTSQQMNRLIREAPRKYSSRQQMLDALRRTWAKTSKENDRG